MATLQKIVPCLWFDSQGEEAARYYVSIFKKNSEIGAITHYGKEGFEIHKRPEGSVMTVTFYLQGQQFTALNGGPIFKFNEATSFEVHCDNQAEIDEYWNKLGAGGDPEAQVCGWLKDKYGLSWQIVPAVLATWMRDATPAQSGRLMSALLQMKKLDIAALKRAYDGK
jgi:predicted 3-demethylubiquinone-9 3-methyltransferase (glyoxalase superfamily)